MVIDLAEAKRRWTKTKFSNKEVVSKLRHAASLSGEVAETGMLPFKFNSSSLTQSALEIHSGLGRDHSFCWIKGLAT